MELLIQKAKLIRLAIFDVDGILTSGELWYGSNGMESKAFHVQDGLGIKMLQQSGITIAVITAKQSDAVTKRMQDLEVKHLYQGQSNKLIAYEKLKENLQVSDQQIAYMGDDLPDLPLLRRVGLAITVPNAPSIIREHAHWVTQNRSGQGAAREVCDFIMQAQNIYQSAIESYLR